MDYRYCHNLVNGNKGVLSCPWTNVGFAPPRGNFLDNNILILLGLWVRKMHVGTRIKVALGDYCLLYQLCQTGKIEAEI